MSAKKKSPRPLSPMTKQLLQIADDYRSETGLNEIDPLALAAWAQANNRADLPRQSVIRTLARAFSRAMREDYIEDDQGEPVRNRHAYKKGDGPKQQVMWFLMEEATPEKMRLSAGWRRRGIQAGCFQLDRDLDYFNKNYNLGEPLEVSYDFSQDVAERKEYGEYDDTPPEDEFED
jgi:hypothetical protein